jgi:hypothetical protein
VENLGIVENENIVARSGCETEQFTVHDYVGIDYTVIIVCVASLGSNVRYQGVQNEVTRKLTTCGRAVVWKRRNDCAGKVKLHETRVGHGRHND